MENAVKPSYYEEALTDLRDKVKDLKNDVEYTKLEDFQILLSAVYSLIDGSDFTSMEMQDPAGNLASREKVDKDLESFTRDIPAGYYLRPIPQSQLDGMEMEEAEKQAYQNPAYRN